MSKLTALAAAMVLSAGMSSAAIAQQGAADAATDDATTATMDQDEARMGDRDDADWGWIGLFGLAGLLGLRRRDRDDVVVRRDATAR
jgi:MYXO-CTERM domain-containing protein